MKGRLLIWAVPGFAGLLLTLTPGRAATQQLGQQLGPQLSPKRLDVLDRLGYFTPAFKTVVHDLVNVRQAVVDAKIEVKTLNEGLPALEKQVAEADGKVAGLRRQLSDLDHTDESDFTELQNKMSEAGATLEEQRMLAQAYVWAYPASPHQAEAQKDLQDVQKKIADQAQAAADAEAARVAAHAKLVQRAQARDLSVAEWRDFLRDMSQEDLLKFLGPPQAANQDDWTYTGGLTEDPGTHQKVGLQIGFNAGRVSNVSEGPH